MSAKKKQAAKPANKFSQYLFPLIIAVATILVYSPSRNNGFTNWDDKEYVTENTSLHELNVKKHFQQEHMGNYHPLTMISFSADYAIGELNPKTYHTTNILFHVLASLMAFAFVVVLTNNRMAAFVSALLFALHPMHVESVAWVSERKDVLYGFFLLAGLWAYIKYISAEAKTKWYVLFTVLFVCSVLSKAVAVVFPVLCLLIDYFVGRGVNRKTILEKIPLFAISLLAGVEAIHAQSTFEAIQSGSLYSYFDRILFSGYGLFTYLWKLFAPLDLSTFYPYPLKTDGAYPPIFYIAPIVSAAIIFVVWKFFRKNKLVVFGSLFFVVSIALVLQILPVGGAVIADRYTYIPYLGLFIIIAVYLFPAGGTANKTTAIGISAVAILLFSFLTYQRIGVWKDSVTLWEDAEKKSKISPKIYNNLGDAYCVAQQYETSLVALNTSLRLKPDYHEALYNRGLTNFFLKKYNEAIDDYTLAIKYKPNLARAFFNRSGTYFTTGQYKLAMDDALKAKELGYEVDPKYIDALNAELNKK